jgi:hypothetical protein
VIRSELMTGSQQPLRKSIATQTDRKLKTWVAGCGCDRREPVVRGSSATVRVTGWDVAAPSNARDD